MGRIFTAHSACGPAIRCENDRCWLSNKQIVRRRPQAKTECQNLN
jgi:hypothetical protein